MIRLATLSILLLLLSAAGSLGQQPAKAPEPEYIGVFFYFDAGKGALMPLERQTAATKIKVKGLGFGGGEGFIEIKGDRSPVRFRADQSLNFVVRVASQQTDPATIIQFFAFEAKKGVRQMLVTKVGSMGLSSKSTVNDKSVSFNATKHGDASFRVSPVQSLPPGEYCLSGPGTNDAFCFGLDAADPSQPAATPKTRLYFAENNRADSLELKPDGAFLLRQGGQELTGKYEIAGNILNLKPAGGPMQTGAIYGDTIIDQGGNKFTTKEAAAKPAVTAPPAPKPAAAETEILTNDDILQMAAVKLSDKVITTKIKSSTCKFDTSTKALIKLKQAGVSDAVIQAMTEKMAK